MMNNTIENPINSTEVTPEKKGKMKPAKKAKVKPEKKVKVKPEKKPKTKPEKTVDTNVVKIPFFKKIGFKLTLCFMVPVVLLIILGVTSYTKAESAIIANYENSSLQTMNSMNQYITLAVDSVQQTYKGYLSEEEINFYFKGVYDHDNIAKKDVHNEYFTGFCSKVMTDDLLSNVYFLSDKHTPIVTSMTKEENLYTKYTETPEGAMVKADQYHFFLFGNQSDADAALKTDSTKYSLRLARHMTGIPAYMIIDFEYDVLQDTLATMDCGEGSYIGLITCDGTEFYSNGATDVNLTELAFYQNALASEESEGKAHVDFLGQDYLFLYSKLDGKNALLVALIPNATVTAQTAEIRNLTIIITVFASLLATLLGTLIARSYSTTIQRFVRNLVKISGGDLTVSVKTNRKDEFSLLGTGINSMTDSMKDLLSDILEVSEELNQVAVQVTNTSETFLQTSQTIQTSVSEIEVGSQRLDTDSDDCLNQMDTLSNQITQVSENTAQIQELAIAAGTSIATGTSSVQKLSDSATSTYEITQNVIVAIEALAEKSKSIGEIITTMNNIAEETSLLSLNASIEAARAGEAGRGFTVVAEQIKKLANQSIAASDEVTKIIEEIVNNTDQAVAVAKQSETIVNNQKDAVQITADSFQDIRDHVDGLVEALEVISANMEQMETERKSTLEAMESIASVATETAACASAVYQTTDEQLTAISTLEVEATNMQKRSEKLSELLKQFKL